VNLGAANPRLLAGRLEAGRSAKDQLLRRLPHAGRVRVDLYSFVVLHAWVLLPLTPDLRPAHPLPAAWPGLSISPPHKSPSGSFVAAEKRTRRDMLEQAA